MKFVRIVPGSEGKLATFKMGSPREEAGRSPWNEEQVDVTITEEFWLGVYEVTEEEFDALKEVKSFDQAEKTGLFAAIFGSRFAKKAAQSEQHDLPASSMTWYQAMEFTRELTKREQASGQLPRNLRYTLPTEAQWEYACRAGTTTAFSVGSGLSLDHTQANFDSHLGVCKVGNYLPNRWGLYDMHGNVWEWCLDQFKTELPGGADPVVNDLVGADETERVIRGGIYFNDASWLRSAARWRRKPNEKAGVRLAVVRVKYDNE